MLYIGPDHNENEIRSLIIEGKISQVVLDDHMGGFDKDYNNYILDRIDQQIDYPVDVYSEYIFKSNIKSKYQKFNFKFDINRFLKHNKFDQFEIYHNDILRHAPAFANANLQFKNFVCSFNGNMHVSRILLVAALNSFKYFNHACSKNFTYTHKNLEDALTCGGLDQLKYHLKIFNDYTNFGSNVIQNFNFNRYQHNLNLYTLKPKLTSSFLHVVSESMATSYMPFVTEKALYSIITKGLYLAYAQPGWHTYLEKYFGFKKYNKIFDYTFDDIQNPVERLIELMCMISRFSNLSSNDWADLYMLEKETIEYNYDNYCSKQYLKILELHSADN